MQYNFDVIPERRSTESVKWGAYDSDVLPLWVADMDFVSPDPVIQALQQRVAHGIFGYPHEQPKLKQAILAHLAQMGWEVDPAWVVLLPGVVTGLNLAAHALARPDGGVLVQTPVYPPFLGIARAVGVLHQEMLLARQPDGSYLVDWDAFEAAITPQTRLFVLCNPHNPVGRVFRRDELERMAEICLRHGLAICSDEIHCDLVFSGYKHLSLAALDPEIARHTVTLMAPSKTYNIAGLESSFAVIPDEAMRKQYTAAGQGLLGWVNLLGLVAAEAAYCAGQEWLEQALHYLEGNRDFLCEYVNKNLPGVRVAKPEGTYLAWLDCRQAGIEGNVYEFFLNEARVALNKGETFGKGGEGFVRLNFGCPRATLTEALERMKRALVK